MPSQKLPLLLRRELVRRFPVRTATLTNVDSLLSYIGSAPNIDAKLARQAALAAIYTLKSRDFKSTSYENTGTFNLHGVKISTSTSYDTTLFKAAVFLGAFAATAYRSEYDGLPSWKTTLMDLSNDDVHIVLRTPLRRCYIVAAPGPTGAASPSANYSKSNYGEVMNSLEAIPLRDRSQVFWQLAGRQELNNEHRERALEFALRYASNVSPLTAKYNLTRAIFREVNTRRFENLFSTALEAWVSVLDSATYSDDPAFIATHERGEFSAEFAEIAEFMDQWRLTTQHLDSAIEAARALRALDRLALPAQDFSLPAFDGTVHKLSEFRGKVVVLNFWATWCAPCLYDLPEIVRIQREWKDRGVVLLGIDDEKPAIVRSFSFKHALPYPTLIDRGRGIHALFGVEGIPAIVIIDRDGALVDRVPYPHTAANISSALTKVAF